MKTISFEDLGLDGLSLKAVEKKGYEIPTPIQALAIPRLLSGDSNLIARARTGTGKTAAFSLPIIQKLRGRTGGGVPLALILAPTRELAMQDSAEIESLTDSSFSVCTIYGGQAMSTQLRALKRGVDIVVGTPGRVIDHLERGTLSLNKIEFFILDEGDEMLDMGFIEDIEKIFSSAAQQSRVLLFSATMPPAVLKIASNFMGEYEIIEEEVLPEEPVLTAQTYWFVRESDKIEALSRLIDSSADFYGLVFTQTKADADMVCRGLEERGFDAEALHGDIAQNQREKILARFRRKKVQILVATDVAARGIDIEGLTHVVNYALPFDSASYVHRIGRTGRAGMEGKAFSLVRPEERRRLEYLKAAIKKAVKGKMDAGKPPSVEETLAAKTARIIEELCAQEPNLSDRMRGVAEELVGRLGAEEALLRVLQKAFGDFLDPSRYREIEEVSERKPRAKRPAFGESDDGFVPKRGGRRSADSFKGGFDSPRRDSDSPKRGERWTSLDGMKQMRLYVSLGYADNMGPREIAKFFSSLVNVPQRQVDRIEVTENFSLVSLPHEAGLKALDKSSRDKKLPHIHIDSKEGGEKDFPRRKRAPAAGRKRG
jgi:ATP-dependent RNA helicase DeaD